MVMKLSLGCVSFLLFLCCTFVVTSLAKQQSLAFVGTNTPKNFLQKSSIMSSSTSSEGRHPFCDLPGDPSLILNTNLDLGDKKMEIMKACSKAIEKHTGKPEAYIAVAINDKQDMIFGGSDAPTALGCVYSLGAIAMESNGAITSSVTDLLEPFGLEANRIYINFFDMARTNVGWNRKTFGG